ncbi:MBL fold metallo-hydrolase [Methanoplanus sp. FWC-SCC4]|uniref:MBL fold metallo-hydrolase n=1 Tax=Methanochimaera problematica TaxID=2609417 RepID=A0AA97I550_9EURY|nr:MBL fold metallo-hydrolase [Methanoplanus sp. FWC-SCC4]WOF17114.1 MBL fold metallo-hydrolase [Methanoplanus sp. FWC-SCC4]
MERYSLVADIPVQKGTLKKIAEIITELNGNINRIHYDRQIDPQTAFFEITSTKEAYNTIKERLSKEGLLRNSLKSLPFLKFSVKLPHRTGALAEFLKYSTDSGALVTSIDFDDTGSLPDKVFVSMNLEDTKHADDLLNLLKNTYTVDIIDYDTTGGKLDRTVFYVKFAREIRQYLADDDEQLLIDFLKDINHTVQELSKLGENTDEIFENYIRCGKFLTETTKNGFYSDVQEVEIKEGMKLFCFQLPGGGSIFLFDTPEEIVMIDTGYGIYADDVREMFDYYGLEIDKKLSYIIATHGDADHCGAGGAYDVPCYMHPATYEIIRCGNRAWGSKSEESVLEKVYTTMIALFSRWNPASEENIRLFPETSVEKRGNFPILAKIPVMGFDFEVLLSMGGHQHGQLIIFSQDAGLLFTADTLMNFSSFSQDRRMYNSIADFLVTSVNVDSELAREERHEAMKIAMKYEEDTGKKCLICGGHGTISILNEEGKPETFGEVRHYSKATKEQ